MEGCVQKQRILIFHIVRKGVQYLVTEITMIKVEPPFQVGVYVSKGGCVPINLL